MTEESTKYTSPESEDQDVLKCVVYFVRDLAEKYIFDIKHSFNLLSVYGLVPEWWLLTVTRQFGTWTFRYLSEKTVRYQDRSVPGHIGTH